MSVITSISANTQVGWANHSTKCRAKKSSTIVERQRESRQKLFNSNRFNIWMNVSDGYLSDDSIDSGVSSLTSDELSTIDVWNELIRSATDRHLNSGKAINTYVTAFWSQWEKVVDNSDAITLLVDKFFDVRFLNRMSSLIGVNTMSVTVQVCPIVAPLSPMSSLALPSCNLLQNNVLKMFDTMVSYQELSDQSINNLIASTMVRKLVEAIDFGRDDLVKSALQLLMSCLEASPSRPDLLIHIIGCGFDKAVYNRIAPLRWKSPKAKTKDMKTQKRPQSVSAQCLTLTSQKLLHHFSQAITQMANYDMPDSERTGLILFLMPLFHQFLSCPDPKVLNNTVNCFVILVQKSPLNTDMIMRLVGNFSHTLLAMIAIKNESVVLSVMQFVNTILESYPQLLFAQHFGPQLLNALSLLYDKNSHKINKEIIDLLLTLSQWIDIRDEKSRHLSDQLFCLALTMLKASTPHNRYNIQNALLALDTLLDKYQFKPFVDFIVSSEQSESLFRQMLATDDPIISPIVIKILSKIQVIIGSNQSVCQKGTHIARQAFINSGVGASIGHNQITI